MGGAACAAKKRMCNPPALATFAIPEKLLDDIASGLLDRKTMEESGLEAYLYRCAYIDEEAQAKYDVANKWYYENIKRFEDGKDVLPPPWKRYEHDKATPTGEGL